MVKKTWETKKSNVAEPVPVTPAAETSPYADYFPMAKRYLEGKTDWLGFKTEVREKGGPLFNRDVLERILADYKDRNP